MTKERYKIVLLKPEEDSLGLDKNSNHIFVQIETDIAEEISFISINPEEAINRLNTYNTIISRLKGILEEPIDRESEIYLELMLYKRKREKLIVGISEYEAKTGKLLLDKNHKVISGINKSHSTLKRKDAFTLLKRLKDDSHKITKSEKGIIEHDSFPHWVSIYMKKQYPIDIFDDYFYELRQIGRLRIDKFIHHTNPPSKWYEKKFINRFMHQCNHPNGKYYNKKQSSSLLRKRIKNIEYFILKDKK